MALSEIIRHLRNKRKLSQRELAKRLNISPSSIAMYETGQRTPDTETLKLLADFFDTTTDYLLERTGDPRPLPLEESGRAQVQVPERIQAFYKKVEDLSSESLTFLEQQAQYLQQLETEISELKKDEHKLDH